MLQAQRGTLATLLAACALLGGPLAAQEGSITGRVTSVTNGQPVANAEVRVLSGGRRVVGSVTNSDGRYRLAVAPGTYTVHVESVGFEAFAQEQVQVTANAPSALDVSLRHAVFSLNPVVVSASKRVEKATEAPAHVEVVGDEAIATRPTVTPVDHLRSTPGVDVVTSGVQSTNVVVRGFNNIFSGALHTLTDHRIAGVPSLRVNFMHFVPTTDDDLQRMEVVLGPGSALYGPNTAHGVLHMITKSPLIEQGTTVSVSGGTRDLMHATFRTAQRVGDRVGLKVSGQYLKATEWEYTDPVEVAEEVKFASNPFFKQDLMRTLDNVPAAERSAEADRRIGLIGNRDFDVERWSGEARADFRATDDLSIILQGGLTTLVNGVELTGLGAGQAQDWKYSYVQARANLGRWFAQAYANMSDAGDTYLLRNGAPIVDKSKLLVGQLQHGFAPRPWLDLTYGVDVLRTLPETEGSINGIYEDDDETTEIGVYLQSQVALHSKLDLVLAGRADDHSGLPETVFSPRAGLVFKASENQAFRLTYNRAFSTPSSLNQYLDLSTASPRADLGQLGYNVRVQGTGTNGFRFGEPGNYNMRSPFFQSGATPLPARATALWAAAVNVVAAQAAAGGTPIPASLVTYLSGLTPGEAQIPTTYLHPASNESGALATLDLPDVDPVRESLTSTIEAGYRGALGGRLMLAADVWYETLENFVTPLTPQTPLLFHAPAQTVAFVTQALIPALTQLYINGGLTPQQAQALAQADAPGLGQQIGGGIAQVPVGVITSADMHATGAQLLTTYYNVDDQIDLYGLDLAATYLLTGNLSLGGTLSLVNKDVFTSDRGEDITLNAPRTKGSVAATFREPEWGFDTELRARFNDDFPVSSGVYNGTLCLIEDPVAREQARASGAAEDCVDSFTLLDLNASYRLPGLRGATLQLYVQNLLDEDYRSYPGVPTIGRMLLTRIKYAF